MNNVRMDEKKLATLPMVYYISDNSKKETIVFVHAAFVNHTQYDEQVRFFSKQYNVITLDLIGHGKSLDLKKGDNIAGTADWINEILIYESISKIHLVGISIGAVLIQDFAIKYPEKVSSLVCLGGYDINRFDVKKQRENSKGQAFMMIKAIFSMKWFAQSNKKISAYTIEAQNRFCSMNQAFSRKSFMYLSGLNGLVNKDRWVIRNYPILIGCGEHDIPMAIDIAKEWSAYEQNSTLLIFEGAGHLVNMDVPKAFNEQLLEFYDLI
ncbi:MAG: alpha/beta hydrolase [Lachnospiraceae bacterium]